MINESSETPYERLRQMEGTHVCGTCGSNLVTIWDNEQAVSVLVCSKDHKHEGVKARQSSTTSLKRGDLDNEHQSGTQVDFEKHLAKSPRESPLLATKDVSTGQELSAQQVSSLVAFADSVGLKAYLGHVCLYFGKPYITIDGYYYLKNSRQDRFMVITTPMTPDERASYQVHDGDHAFLSRAITAGGDEISRGIGIITKEEIEGKSKRDPDQFSAPVVHNKPQVMAEKRAEWQLLQKMIPLGVENKSGNDKSGEKQQPVVGMSEDLHKSLWE